MRVSRDGGEGRYKYAMSTSAGHYSNYDRNQRKPRGRKTSKDETKADIVFFQTTYRKYEYLRLDSTGWNCRYIYVYIYMQIKACTHTEKDWN